MTTRDREDRIRAKLARVAPMTLVERARQRESFAEGSLKIDERPMPRGYVDDSNRR
jgi:hypothetical protein